METVAVVLNVGNDRVDEFLEGFRTHEVPVWEDLKGRGEMLRASISRLDISSRPVEGSTQFLIVAVFATGEVTTSTTAIPASRPGTRSPTHTRSASRWRSAARRSSR